MYLWTIFFIIFLIQPPLSPTIHLKMKFIAFVCYSVETWSIFLAVCTVSWYCRVKFHHLCTKNIKIGKFNLEKHRNKSSRYCTIFMKISTIILLAHLEFISQRYFLLQSGSDQNVEYLWHRNINMYFYTRFLYTLM